MAIYKRYNTRRKKVNYGLIIWICAILAVFTVTAVVGYALGKKAEGGESYIDSEGVYTDDSETLASVIPHIMQAVYVAPDALAGFVGDSAAVYASTWLYKDGEANFATAVDASLGEDINKKTSTDAFKIESPISGMFEVSSVYAEENVREILEAYEKALIKEFSALGPDEIVLTFREVSAENSAQLLDFAASVGGAVVAVPYETLYESFFVRFLSTASEKGMTVALMADGLSDTQLSQDIDDYAVYFTRDFLRVMLPSGAEALVDVLYSKNVINYQFYS